MTINWRKMIIFTLFKATHNPVLQELEFLRSIEHRSASDIQDVQNERLINLLRHAWENTLYYKEVLSNCGVVVDGEVHLDRFDEIPILTKETILQQGDRLKATVLPNGRKPYINRTGGSTGQPTVFYQDNHYWNVNVATKNYHFEVHGKQVGELEMKVWGSDRDVVHDTSGWLTKFKNYLYNREIRACGHMTDQDIEVIVQDINSLKPRTIWGYTDGIYTIAKYILRAGLTVVHPPAALFGGGGTLLPRMRETIEEAFGAPMINMYGSREMGDVACECEKQVGLHISSHSHRVEVLGTQGRPVIDQDGDIIITSLHNYAMPFIRYNIGDRGRLTGKKCSCGRGFPLLESVLGRSMESFMTAEGAIVSPTYLISVLGTALNPHIFKKFQLIQHDIGHVNLKAVLGSGVNPDEVRAHFSLAEERVRSVMGERCDFSHTIVDDIPSTESGKYLYTVCEVPTQGYSSELELSSP